MAEIIGFKNTKPTQGETLSQAMKDEIVEHLQNAIEGVRDGSICEIAFVTQTFSQELGVVCSGLTKNPYKMSCGLDFLASSYKIEVVEPSLGFYEDS